MIATVKLYFTLESLNKLTNLNTLVTALGALLAPGQLFLVSMPLKIQCLYLKDRRYKTPNMAL